MKRILSCLLAIYTVLGVVHAQQPRSAPGDEKMMIRGELERYRTLFGRQDAASAEERIDVTYYKLDVKITTTPQYLRGSVTMKATSTVNGLASIRLDMMNSLTMDSVAVNGIPVSFTQSTSTFDVTLDHSYASGEAMTVVMYYEGIPGNSGFGSFEFSTHSGTPWVWSLSEPYGAKDWWPCKDHPGDKADSLDVYVTVDSMYRVGSEGKLMSVTNNGDGTSTHHWHHHYPISTYLVSVAITNYASFTNYFKYSPTDSMPVLNYVLPENLSSALAQLPTIIPVLQTYSDLFGLYAFIDEKYGHSQFGWGGGMEHQTMTSLGGFSEGLIAHECAHQWFGDMITCKTWPDIWLNEGFATYLTGLYYENRYGSASYWSYMNGNITAARNAIGSIYVTDTSSVGRLFDGALVYDKGAVVLHMLRHILGDSVFYHSMWAYAHDPSFRFNVASTRDFQSVVETVSGKNLAYFFDEWIYGENYPIYTYTWTADPSGSDYTVHFNVSQTTGTANPAFFTMPLDLKVSAPGWDTTVVVFNDSATQTLTFNVSHAPTAVKLDTANWVLKSVASAMTVAPTRLNMLPIILIGSSKTDSLTVTNTAGVPLKILSATCDLADVTVSPDTATIGAGGVKKFYVTYTPQTAGLKYGSVTFAYNSSGSPRVVQVTVAAKYPQFNYSLPAGWTMLSLPANVGDPRKSVLFPEAIDGPYRFFSDSGYKFQDSLQPGIGYWMKFPSAGPVTVLGLPIFSDTVSLMKGWNLIGSLASPLPISAIVSDPTGNVVSRYFGFRGSYMTVDTIGPGQGYWVKAADPGILILDTAGAYAKTSVTADPLLELDHMTIADNLGNGRTLYFGRGGGDFPAGFFESPPVPPAGVFDARFAGGTFAEFSDGRNTREIGLPLSSPKYPLTISWEVGASSGRASLMVGGREIPMSGSGSVLIADPRSMIRLRLGPDGAQAVPSEFALRQNYPNPFNPGTTISFDVPRKSFIDLRVFNTLGEEIATLVDGIQDAGTYEVQFDASKLPSGVYFYELSGGDFHATKKLVLLK